MRKIYKSILVLLILLLSESTLKAQDVIIKNNKEEIKAKVLEIEEFNIKYKKFEFQDGPTYSIKKSEVFMILYKNGTRETFPNSQSPVNTPSSNTTQTPIPQNQPSVNKRTNSNMPPVITPSTQPATTSESNNTSTASDILDYEPSRILIGFSSVEDVASTFTLITSSENKLVKNWINWGITGIASITSFDDMDGSSSLYGFGVYVSGYLPVNRLRSSYGTQDKGFFPFVQLGTSFAGMSVPAIDADGEETTASSYGFVGVHNIGLDYKFSKGFGLSLATDIRSLTGGFVWGINFQF